MCCSIHVPYNIEIVAQLTGLCDTWGAGPTYLKDTPLQISCNPSENTAHDHSPSALPDHSPSSAGGSLPDHSPSVLPDHLPSSAGGALPDHSPSSDYSDALGMRAQPGYHVYSDPDDEEFTDLPAITAAGLSVQHVQSAVASTNHTQPTPPLDSAAGQQGQQGQQLAVASTNHTHPTPPLDSTAGQQGEQLAVTSTNHTQPTPPSVVTKGQQLADEETERRSELTAPSLASGQWHTPWP